MTDRNLIYLAAALTLVMAVIVGVLTLMPGLTPPGALSGGKDKLYHFLAFMVLALPLTLVQSRRVLPIVVVLALYGALIEVIQPFVGRGREMADWYADMAGVATGVAIGLLGAGLKSRVRLRQRSRAEVGAE